MCFTLYLVHKKLERTKIPWAELPSLPSRPSGKGKVKDFVELVRPKPGGPSSLRVFPLFAFISRGKGSSGAVATMPFVWRSHAKSPTTRAGRALDIALWLE